MTDPPVIIELARRNHERARHPYRWPSMAPWESLASWEKKPFIEQAKTDYSAVFEDLMQPSEEMLGAALMAYLDFGDPEMEWSDALMTTLWVEMIRARAREIGVEVE